MQKHSSDQPGRWGQRTSKGEQDCGAQFACDGGCEVLRPLSVNWRRNAAAYALPSGGTELATKGLLIVADLGGMEVVAATSGI